MSKFGAVLKSYIYVNLLQLISIASIAWCEVLLIGTNGSISMAAGLYFLDVTLLQQNPETDYVGR